MKKILLSIILFILFISSVYAERLPRESENPYYNVLVGWLNVSHTENGTIKADLNRSIYDLNVTNNLIVLGNANITGNLTVDTIFAKEINQARSQYKNS